jgi:CheY-like chemotaxis protein
MVEKILIFSKNRKPHPVAINLAEIVRETVKMAKGSIPPDIEVYVEEKCQPTVKMDQSHLTQVILNIVLNARDALMEKGGTGKIVLIVECDDKYAILRIGNNGPPIPEEILDKIFEPFFTTKAKGGTGLGLAIVKKLVETAGGTIDVSSTENWTEFVIRLPIYTEEKNREILPSPQSQEIPKGNGEKILLVEDDETVGRALKNLLEQNGYVVKWIKNPEETADILESWEPDIVISDYAMPRLTGKDIVRIVRMLAPNTPVLIITAYEGVDTAGAPVLMKPIRPSDLMKTIRGLLEKHGGTDNG